MKKDVLYRRNEEKSAVQDVAVAVTCVRKY